MTARARGLLAAGAVMVTLTACRVGYNPEVSPVATRPRGTFVIVDWTGPSTSYWGDRAELIAVADSGLYLLHGSSLVLYPMGVPARLTGVDARVGRLDLRRPDSETLVDLRYHARYPFGLDSQQLLTFARWQGADSIVVRRSGG